MDRRKELKLEYKQTPLPMGVYQLTNNVNGKVLIGSSMNLPGKKNSLLFQLKSGCHSSKDLQADWNEFGAAAFSFAIVETIKAEETAQENWRDAVAQIEKKWLAALQPYGERGYNKPKTMSRTR